MRLFTVFAALGVFAACAPAMSASAAATPAKKASAIRIGATLARASGADHKQAQQQELVRE